MLVQARNKDDETCFVELDDVYLIVQDDERESCWKFYLRSARVSFHKDEALRLLQMHRDTSPNKIEALDQ